MDATFRDMAKAAGLPSKPFYTFAEAARATGVPKSTLYAEHQAGRLTVFVSSERRGFLLRPEWVDEWIDQGTVRAV